MIAWAVLNYCSNDTTINNIAVTLMMILPILLLIGLSLTCLDLSYISVKDYLLNRVILYRIVGLFMIILVLSIVGGYIGVSLSPNEEIKEHYASTMEDVSGYIVPLIVFFIAGFVVLTPNPIIFKIIEISWGLATIVFIFFGLTGEDPSQYVFGIHITSYFVIAIICAIVAVYTRSCYKYLLDN